MNNTVIRFILFDDCLFLAEKCKFLDFYTKIKYVLIKAVLLTFFSFFVNVYTFILILLLD